MTPEQIKTLDESIKDLENGDYSAPCSGWTISLYLDPEEHRLYTCEGVNPGVPMAAWHGRETQVCHIPANAIPYIVRCAITEIRDGLITLCDRYLGSEWDGSNHVGRWEQDDEYDWYDIEVGDIACYHDAAEWFYPVQDEIKEALRAGKTPEQVILDYDLGDSDHGEVNEQDAVEYVESVRKELQS